MLTPTPCTSNVTVPFFEGTEKRIEMSFSGIIGKGLMAVKDTLWYEVVQLSGTKIKASRIYPWIKSFILSESSLIVYPDKVILKTCGTTDPLNAVEKILAIARDADLEPQQLSYSRASFLALDKQPPRYRSQEEEIAFCKRLCDGLGEAYPIGPLARSWFLFDANFKHQDYSNRGALTVDIIMYGLPKDVQKIFFTSEAEGSRAGAQAMTKDSRIDILAASITRCSFQKPGQVDDYCFSPCGYSCNVHLDKAYMMVHVAPQDGCSYASFETNYGSSFDGKRADSSSITSLIELNQGVLDAFQPAKLTMTVLGDWGALGDKSPLQALYKDYKVSTITTITDYIAGYSRHVADCVRKTA